MRSCVNSWEITSWNLSFPKVRLFANCSKRFMRKNLRFVPMSKSVCLMEPATNC